MNKVTYTLALTLFTSALGTVALANPPSPPPEAIAACATSRDGDTCTVKFGDHEVTGTCATTPDKILACRPNGPPPIPKEAVDACASSKDGDACTVKFGEHEMKGTCAATPDRGLACRPEGPPPAPPQ